MRIYSLSYQLGTYWIKKISLFSVLTDFERIILIDYRYEKGVDRFIKNISNNTFYK